MLTTQQKHTVWETAFDLDAQTQLRQDDSDAWRSVTGILITIVSVGVAIAVFSVWACL